MPMFKQQIVVPSKCKSLLRATRAAFAVAAAASRSSQPRPQGPAQRPSPKAAKDHKQGRVAEAAPSLPTSEPSDLVKGINRNITLAKRLDELRAIYTTSGAEFNTVCIATAWMKLAKLPDSEAPKLERLAFARKALLGKTLDLVHQMEVRPLANVLWAVGKLRLDLARQVPLGPRLGQQLEGRIRQLVAGGALQDHHAVQLWYGMYFSRYRWSWELLHTLVAAQLPLMDTMNIKGLSTVLFHIKAFKLRLSQEQLQQLAEVVERRVSAFDATDETFCSLNGIIEAAEQLPLPLSPTCVEALHDHAIRTPRDLAQGTLRTRVMSGTLFSLQRLGHVCTSHDASVWCDLLLGTWRAAPVALDAFAFMLTTLVELVGDTPPEELREEVVEVAAWRSGWSPTAARRVLTAARRWRVELPERDVRRLEGIAAAVQREGRTGAGKQAGARGR